MCAVIDLYRTDNMKLCVGILGSYTDVPEMRDDHGSLVRIRIDIGGPEEQSRLALAAGAECLGLDTGSNATGTWVLVGTGPYDRSIRIDEVLGIDL
ncbi:MAG TPA: hypothetical protein DIT01_05075 [Lentisphaeria bacterium]|nr:hypothetical protein [Lentisphaeria bacterium]